MLFYNILLYDLCTLLICPSKKHIFDEDPLRMRMKERGDAG